MKLKHAPSTNIHTRCAAAGVLLRVSRPTDDTPAASLALALLLPIGCRA